MTAAQRIESLDQTDARELCARADASLTRLVEILSHETMLLRAGKLREAGVLAADKTVAAEDYTILARAVQRQATRLAESAPVELAKLRQRHESLATQMAENLRVLATARAVAEDLLEDVALSVGAQKTVRTYSASGATPPPKPNVSGLSVNRAL